MNDIFNYNGRNIRVVIGKDGEPWFVAKDVCEILGIDTSNLSKTLDADERDTCTVNYTDQVRKVSIVSEPGLYSLVGTSRKPEAKAFKRWVNHEVLPSIRKHGMYATDNTIDAILNNPDFLANTLLKLKEESDKRKKAIRIFLLAPFKSAKNRVIKVDY